MHKFFKDDLDALDAKIEELRQTLRDTAQQIGAACEDGEREHDNPEFDDANRRFEMWNRHLHDFSEIRREAELIDSTEVVTEHVSVGCTVTFVDQDERERTVSIGSYQPSEASTDISYNAPIARLLMGLHVGESREGKIGKQEVEYEVLKIERTAGR